MSILVMEANAQDRDNSSNTIERIRWTPGIGPSCFSVILLKANSILFARVVRSVLIALLNKELGRKYFDMDVRSGIYLRHC